MIITSRFDPISTSLPDTRQAVQQANNNTELLKKEVSEQRPSVQRKTTSTEVSGFLQDRKDGKSKFQSIDSMALYGLLGQMGAMDPLTASEKGNLIDIYA